MTTALRPMTIGEVLDRTFNLYRSNFQMFVAIGTVPAAMWFGANAFFVLMQNFAPRSKGGFQSTALAVSAITLVVAFGVYICGTAISHGAVAYAVSAIHLGRSTGFAESYRRLRGKYFRIFNVVISVTIRIFGTGVLLFTLPFLLLLLPGFKGNEALAIALVIIWIIVVIVGIWMMLRLTAKYSFSIPACVLEDLKTRLALRRSAALARGSAGRILVVYILFAVINGAFGFAVQLPFQIAIVAVKTQTSRVILALGNVFSASLIAAVVGPLAVIALTLLYYDERVRKEAFDLHFMMEMLDHPDSSPTTPPVPENAAGATSA